MLFGALPLAMVRHFLQAAFREGLLQGSDFFLGARGEWLVGWAVVGFSLAVTAGQLRHSPEAVEARLLVARPAILEAAHKTGADPALLAALASAQLSAPGLPLPDRKRLFRLPSETALQALAIWDGWEGSGCDWQALHEVGRQWFRAMSRPGHLADVQRPVPAGVTASALWRALETEEVQLRLAGLVVSLHSALWVASNPAWSIRNRPEVLATLFDRPFRDSHPGPEPLVSDFGREVLEAYRSEFIQTHFTAASHGQVP